MEYPPSEEQTLPRFFQRRYYPVRIGQLFNGRYRILTKLGYGANSTVWLTRDQSTNGYSSIKVFIRDNSDASPVTNELKILRHLATLPSEHELVRLPLDTFEVEGHSCLVMAPQACSLQHLQHCFADRRVPREFMMAVVIRLLGCINWLQLDCGVVHTEITPQNIMMTAIDDTIFRRAEEEESANPSVPFMISTQHTEYPVYPSRGQTINLWEASGPSILGDFGSARLLQPAAATEGWWMPDTYRAPEILMGLPWDHGVDVWSIGVMMLELLEGRNLFNPIDKAHNQYVLPLALAQYMGYMGLPPL